MQRKDEASRLVLQTVINNEGCTNDELYTELDGILSPVTIRHVLKKLENGKQIQDKRPKPNSRDHCWVPVGKSVLVYGPAQLIAFRKAFRVLLKAAAKKTESTTGRDSGRNEFAYTRYLLAPLELYSLLARFHYYLSIRVWPELVSNIEMRKELMSATISVLVDIQRDINETFLAFKAENLMRSIDTVLQNDSTYDELSGPPLLDRYLKIFKKQGLEGPGLPVLNALWNFTLDMRERLIPIVVMDNIHEKRVKPNFNDWQSLLSFYSEDLRKQLAAEVLTEGNSGYEDAETVVRNFREYSSLKEPDKIEKDEAKQLQQLAIKELEEAYGHLEEVYLSHRSVNQMVQSASANLYFASKRLGLTHEKALAVVNNENLAASEAKQGIGGLCFQFGVSRWDPFRHESTDRRVGIRDDVRLP